MGGQVSWRAIRPRARDRCFVWRSPTLSLSLSLSLSNATGVSDVRDGLRGSQRVEVQTVAVCTLKLKYAGPVSPFTIGVSEILEDLLWIRTYRSVVRVLSLSRCCSLVPVLVRIDRSSRRAPHQQRSAIATHNERAIRRLSRVPSIDCECHLGYASSWTFLPSLAGWWWCKHKLTDGWRHAAKSGERLPGTPIDVDALWHTHMLEPATYNQDLTNAFGFTFHHLPKSEVKSPLPPAAGVEEPCMKCEVLPLRRCILS